ncbi:MAG: hypothetical protein ACRDP4_00185 [Nocardioidaceae bacterium]
MSSRWCRFPEMIRYATAEEAWQLVDKIRACGCDPTGRPEGLQVYRCHRHWHVGHKMPGKDEFGNPRGAHPRT